VASSCSSRHATCGQSALHPSPDAHLGHLCWWSRDARKTGLWATACLQETWLRLSRSTSLRRAAACLLDRSEAVAQTTQRSGASIGRRDNTSGSASPVPAIGMRAPNRTPDEVVPPTITSAGMFPRLCATASSISNSESPRLTRHSPRLLLLDPRGSDVCSEADGPRAIVRLHGELW
jgi:hypothetical protein